MVQVGISATAPLNLFDSKLKQTLNVFALFPACPTVTSVSPAGCSRPTRTATGHCPGWRG